MMNNDPEIEGDHFYFQAVVKAEALENLTDFLEAESVKVNHILAVLINA